MKGRTTGCFLCRRRPGYAGNDAWNRPGNISDINKLDVEPLTKHGLPAGKQTPFTVSSADMPNLFRVFNPEMTAVFYTTEKAITIALGACVQFQNTKIHYEGGFRNSLSHDVFDRKHTESFTIRFPEGDIPMRLQ